MNNQAELKRGERALATGGGEVFQVPPVPSFYRPENAHPFMALQGRFARAHQGPDWLEAVRARGVAAMAVEGLPTPLLERWKYSPLVPRLKGLPKDLGEAGLSWRDPEGVAQELGAVLREAPAWLQDLVAAPPPGQARYKDMGLWHLADAFLQGGVFVDIPAGKSVEKPLELTLAGAEGAFFNQRAIIRLGAGARLTVIEYVHGKGASWGNHVAQIVLEDGAALYHYRIQDCPQEAVYTQTTHVAMGAGARYEAFALASGAGFSRNQVHAELRGAESFVRMNGINLLRGAQLGDNSFLIEHQAPDCGSSQMVRSVLDEQARGVFQGKVHVHRAGQRTDGYQLCNTLILSEGAEMDTKPELEIYADDVKCSHGATIGQVDEEALFYMRSRGLDLATARALLIEGFLAEVVEPVAHEAMRTTCLGKIREWLRALG